MYVCMCVCMRAWMCACVRARMRVFNFLFYNHCANEQKRSPSLSFAQPPLASWVINHFLLGWHFRYGVVGFSFWQLFNRSACKSEVNITAALYYNASPHSNTHITRVTFEGYHHCIFLILTSWLIVILVIQCNIQKYLFHSVSMQYQLTSFMNQTNIY